MTPAVPSRALPIFGLARRAAFWRGEPADRGADRDRLDRHGGQRVHPLAPPQAGRCARCATAREGSGAHGWGRRDPVDARCSAAAAYRLAGRALAVRAAGVEASAAPRPMAGYGRAGYCMSARSPSVLRQTASPERKESAAARTLKHMAERKSGGEGKMD